MKKTLSLLILFLIPFFSFAEKYEDLVATDYVNDYAGVLTQEQKLELSKTLGDLEKAKGYQIAVAIVNDLDGDYIEHYAVKLYEKWGMGTKEKDEGALFLVSINDRTMRIEVGYGLEPVLTDGITKNILDNEVRPEFKNGDYYAGIKKGIDSIVTVSNGGIMPEATNSNSSSDTDWFSIIVILFVIGVNMLGWLFAILARSKSWWLGGLITFLIGAPFLFFLGFTVLNNVLLFLFTITGFIFDYFVSKNYKYWQNQIKSGGQGNPAWWAGGTWGPGSGGFSGSGRGSGWGGFGGGGMSGGGGSSSSW